MCAIRAGKAGIASAAYVCAKQCETSCLLV